MNNREELEFGFEGKIAKGVRRSDVARVHGLAVTIAGPNPFAFLGSGSEAESGTIFAEACLRVATERGLSTALDRAKQILYQHRPFLRGITWRLRENGCSAGEIVHGAPSLGLHAMAAIMKFFSEHRIKARESGPTGVINP
jgi:hypothetical protein